MSYESDFPVYNERVLIKGENEEYNIGRITKWIKLHKEAEIEIQPEGVRYIYLVRVLNTEDIEYALKLCAESYRIRWVATFCLKRL